MLGIGLLGQHGEVSGLYINSSCLCMRVYTFLAIRQIIRCDIQPTENPSHFHQELRGLALKEAVNLDFNRCSVHSETGNTVRMHPDGLNRRSIWFIMLFWAFSTIQNNSKGTNTPALGNASQQKEMYLGLLPENLVQIKS